MNSTEFTYLLENPEKIDGLNTSKLDTVLNEFPYFQAARAIQLKGLSNSNSFKYNQSLKKTAAFTIDRKVLFEYITSPIFISNSKKVEELEDITVIEPELVQNFIENNNSNTEEEKNITATVLEIGKPLEFKSTEPHSFNEWMQLASKKPIKRKENNKITEENDTNSTDKFNLIEKFIASNPKIKPVDKTKQNIDISQESSKENDHLMTETLAKVYLEQKKYDSAIKAYRILSLKYPEKSGFFADRIKAIKKIQNK
ncbi:hypothetical protein SAMN05444411_10589 [Lutibacter oricola]|uniref:Tetratricopeptide repeat-containing protein n=1 Tax=Lutibacter oricola TaxID=762486 RepID=A0A1H3BE74_9FLAO|nr:hypothetical protein [Lutibacter oricola]SDX39951.1 hypothetical protein SAMN05444411_10589 [Lutibacter oricola]